MNDVLKAIVVWFMFVAIPFQGIAAAAMICCTPTHSEGVAKGSGAAEFTKHYHADDFSLTAVSADHLSPGHVHDGHTSEREAYKCSACAACCTGVAIVPTLDNAFGVARTGSTRIAFHPAYFYGFVPDTLERPPYRFLV